MKEKLWNANYIKVMTTNFLLYFAFYLLTPLLPLYLSETFGATKDVIGIVLSGYTVAALIIRPFSGYVVDSFSRKKVLMVSLDVQRPAAQEQLRVLGEQAGVPTLPIIAGQMPVDIAKRAVTAGKLSGCKVLEDSKAGKGFDKAALCVADALPMGSKTGVVKVPMRFPGGA